MVKYKVIYNQNKCEGVLFSCVELAGKFWVKGENGKAILKGSTYNKKTGNWELFVSEEEVPLFEEIVSRCHIGAIEIIKVDE